jgi:predicted ArsR family transcriptional regulator
MSHYPEIAGAKTGTTSRDAAEKIEASGRAHTLREEVRFAFQCGYEGTADELARQLAEHPLAIRPRVSELHKKGYIEKTGRTRRSLAGGRQSHVWRKKSA